MALLVSFSVKKGNEGIGVWLHFGYSLNEEAATSFLSRVILMPYRFDSGLRHDFKEGETLILQRFSYFFVILNLITVDYTFILNIIYSHLKHFS